MAKINRKLVIKRLEEAQQEIHSLKSANFNLADGIYLGKLVKSLKLKVYNKDMGILEDKYGTRFSIQQLYCKYFMFQSGIEKVMFHVAKTKSSTYKIEGIEGLPKKTTLEAYQKHFDRILKKFKAGEMDEWLLPEQSAAYSHIRY